MKIDFNTYNKKVIVNMHEPKTIKQMRYLIIL